MAADVKQSPEQLSENTFRLLKAFLTINAYTYINSRQEKGHDADECEEGFNSLLYLCEHATNSKEFCKSLESSIIPTIEKNDQGFLRFHGSSLHSTLRAIKEILTKPHFKLSTFSLPAANTQIQQFLTDQLKLEAEAKKAAELQRKFEAEAKKTAALEATLQTQKAEFEALAKKYQEQAELIAAQQKELEELRAKVKPTLERKISFREQVAALGASASTGNSGGTFESKLSTTLGPPRSLPVGAVGSASFSSMATAASATTLTFPPQTPKQTTSPMPPLHPPAKPQESSAEMALITRKVSLLRKEVLLALIELRNSPDQKKPIQDKCEDCIKDLILDIAKKEDRNTAILCQEWMRDKDTPEITQKLQTILAKNLSDENQYVQNTNSSRDRVTHSFSKIVTESGEFGFKAREMLSQLDDLLSSEYKEKISSGRRVIRSGSFSIR